MQIISKSLSGYEIGEPTWQAKFGEKEFLYYITSLVNDD